MASQIPPGTDLSQVPAGKPPPGVTPNFDNPPSLTSTLVGMSAFLIVWGTTFATIRIWNNRKRLSVGDAFVATAVVLSIAYCSVLLSIAKYFRHQWDTPLSWYTPAYMKLLYTQGMFLGPTIFFSKEAIFLLYFDLFHVRKGMRIVIIAGMVFTALAYWPGIALESIFCAAHPGETWDPLQGARISRTCSKNNYWGIAQGACAIVIDILIFTIPIPAVIRLQMKTGRKIQILAVFSTGLLGIVASVLAEVYRVRLLQNAEGDLAFATAQQLICVVVENWVAIIVSSMPAFATFSRRYIGESNFFRSLQSNFRSWTSSSHKASTAGGISKQKLGSDLEGSNSKGTSHSSTARIGGTTTTTTIAGVSTLASHTDAEGRYYKLDDLSAQHAERARREQ